jgi:UDP-N-acetylglucosamine--N-acetylmuramyl-(pentapeptide) pyrophosphoryl-undecaprenol N-acetylglucosamine transferase
MRVLLAGGGSGGSTTPVLAVAQELRSRRPCEFLYVGTEGGPERDLVASLGIPFHTVRTGKLRRYWSIQNLLDLMRIPAGLVESLAIVRSFRPDVAFAAGGFGAVPPLLAAGILRVPVVIHQQDVEPGLANRILSPIATAVTITFPASLGHFPRSKTMLTGNPVRREILAGSRQQGLQLLGWGKDRPTVMVTGGGTGALGLNRLVAKAAPLLVPNCQILHITGRGKGVEVPGLGSGYQQREFLTGEMGHALAAADLVVSRAGLSTLTEIAALGKPSLLIPMPRSHQNANARAFATADAALVLQEDELSPERLAQEILALLRDEKRLAALGERARSMMPAGAETRISDVIERVAKPT